MDHKNIDIISFKTGQKDLYLKGELIQELVVQTALT